MNILTLKIKVTLKEIIFVSKSLLKEGGKLYLIHLKSREKEIEKELKNNDFKILNFEDLEGKLKRIIIEAKKM